MSDMSQLGKQLFDREVDRMRKDAATQRMLTSFNRQRQYTERMGLAEQRERSYQEVADEMNANFEAGEAKSINGGMA